MTTLQAKEETLKLWEYIRDHPKKITQEHHKADAAIAVGLTHIKEYTCYCPLCQMFWKGQSHEGCPLNAGKGHCLADGEPYADWVDAETSEERAEAAERLINIVKEWEPE